MEQTMQPNHGKDFFGKTMNRTKGYLSKSSFTSVKQSNDLTSSFISKLYKEVKKSLCLMIVGKVMVTGFFIKIKLKGKEKEKVYLCCNNHIITDELIKRKGEVSAIFDEEFYKGIELRLRLDKREIVSYKVPIDLVFVEILDRETGFMKYKEKELEVVIKLNEIYPILPDLSFPGAPQNAKGLNVILYHHSKGQPSIYESRGDIAEVQNMELIYDFATDEGSYGAPIINTNTKKVIGVNKGETPDKKRNTGTFIGAVV